MDDAAYKAMAATIRRTYAANSHTESPPSKPLHTASNTNAAITPDTGY
jgi:hypothetical protein